MLYFAGFYACHFRRCNGHDKRIIPFDAYFRVGKCERVCHVALPQDVQCIKTIEAINAIDTSGTPDCRLPDGVRDAVNSARANANSASARRTEAGMPTAPNDGRESREPRAPRG